MCTIGINVIEDLKECEQLILRKDDAQSRLPDFYYL